MTARRRGSLVLALAMMLTVDVTSLKAQQWSLEAQGGRMRASLDPSSVATQSLVLGIKYSDAFTQFRISGGVPTKADDPFWGSAGGSRRFAFRQSGFVAGVDLTAQGFVLSDRVERTREVPGPGPLGGTTLEPAPSLSGTAFAGMALPLIGYETDRLQVHVRAGASAYTSDFGGHQADRTVRIADAQVTFAPVSTFAVVPALRRFDAEDGKFTHAGITAIAAIGQATVWGSMGSWIGLDSIATPWSAGVSLNVHPRATLTASASKEVFDPLYLTAPQTAWSAGVSVRVGGRSAPPAPVPAAYVNGRATIKLPKSQASGQPRIAGDFTGWKPQPMQLVNGAWVYSAPITPGVYNYAFVNERNEWFVPEKFPGRKPDGMGGYVAVLVVQP